MKRDKNSYPERNASGKPQCIRCGKPIILLSRKFIEKIYGEEGDVKGLTKFCPACRRRVLWEGCVFKT